MMNREDIVRDNQALIDFWDKAFTTRENEGEEPQDDQEADWKELAPSDKLFEAARSLGQRKKVLDYGCGSGWASVIAAKSGCADVTAADAAPGAVQAARECAAYFDLEDRIIFERAVPGWLQSIPAETYDGLICSNVLDVIPPETTEEVIREFARIIRKEADVIIGLNYYLSPEAAAARGMKLVDGTRLYVDGVLRLVSRTDDEWMRIFTPWFTVEQLDHFAWAGEAKETRRLFRLRKREA